MPIKITEEEWIPAQEKFESGEDFRSFTDARASRRLSAIVPLNRKPSWGTTTTRSRRLPRVASRRSHPPSEIDPSSGS